jgi:hypothetical protein
MGMALSVRLPLKPCDMVNENYLCFMQAYRSTDSTCSTSVAQ